MYVARWTTLHVRQLIRSMEAALAKRGFAFVEVISPCPTLYTRRNKLGSGLDWMRMLRDMTDVRNGADPGTVDIGFKERITIGTFVDIEKPTLQDKIDESMKAALGEAYTRIDAAGTDRSERRALLDR